MSIAVAVFLGGLVGYVVGLIVAAVADDNEYKRRKDR